MTLWKKISHHNIMNPLIKVGLYIVVAYIAYKLFKMLVDGYSSNGGQMPFVQTGGSSGPSAEKVAHDAMKVESGHPVGYNSAILPHPAMSTMPSPAGVVTFDHMDKPPLTSADLLPKEDIMPPFAGVPTDGTAAHHDYMPIGTTFGQITSIGGSGRRANHQIRSDPPIPKIEIGPFNQSTYGPDSLNQVPFGEGCPIAAFNAAGLVDEAGPGVIGA